MPYYELLCLASGKLNRAELTDVLRKTCRAFMDNGATVTRVAPLGATGNGPRKLAYQIRRNQVSYDTGYYVNVCAFSSPSTLDEVRRQLRIDERMLRHTVFRRRTLDALAPLGQVDDMPPVHNVVESHDPQFELQKFLSEFQRDFPDGFSTGAVRNSTAVGRKNAKDVDDSAQEQQESSVRDILARLKAPSASSPPAAEEQDGLAWLSKLKKPDPPDNSKP